MLQDYLSIDADSTWLIPCTDPGNWIVLVTRINTMTRVVLCIPNFSEGRNQDVLDAISKSISETPGCCLLDVSAGQSTNRSVYTFAGAPEAVVLGALNSARIAHRLIDMSTHEGIIVKRSFDATGLRYAIFKLMRRVSINIPHASISSTLRVNLSK